MNITYNTSETKTQSNLMSFMDAMGDMGKILYENNLYREGSIYITYDREDHEFHVYEHDGTSGTPSDEYPHSEDYCQTTILTIIVSELDNNFNECLNLEKSLYKTKKSKQLLWESVVDDAISNAYDAMSMNENRMAALFELDELEGMRGITKPELSYYYDSAEHNNKAEVLEKVEETNLLEDVKREILEYIIGTVQERNYQ